MKLPCSKCGKLWDVDKDPNFPETHECDGQ